MRRRTLVLVSAIVLGLTACTSGHSESDSSTAVRGSSTGSVARTTSSEATTTTPASTSSKPTTPRTTPPTTQPTGGLQLPRGGVTLLPNYRIVAYYGAPGNPGLGVLGKGTPDQAADAIEERAAQYRPYGRPVQPAMELIATVAQGSAGADGDYSAPVSMEAVQKYLDAAHRHKMLLVLDFQPGRGDFLPQVKQFSRFLTDPSVGVALDPEWKVGPTQKPAQVIGHASAASINAVSAYLSALVTARHLPQKLFVVHQFTLRMLPDRQNILGHKQLATVFHADGHGSIPSKQAVYAALNFPRTAGAGFKLFLREDAKLMTPAQVMALPRRPDLVTYQ
ncbi:MAG: hypothetical protein ACR2KJ_14135 [Jatrophihabitans sp.]